MSSRASSEAYGFAVGIVAVVVVVVVVVFEEEEGEATDPPAPVPPIALFAGVFVDDGAVAGVEADGPAAPDARAGGAMGPKGDDP